MNRVFRLVLCALTLGTFGSAAAQSDFAATPRERIAAAAGDRDSFLPDFSYAGYGFGLEDVPYATGTVIDVAVHGAFPDDGKDDTAAFKAALDAARATEGPVIIRLESGRYAITDILQLDRSDLVIRGAGQGEGGTELYFPRPLAMVDVGERFDELRRYLVKYNKRQREPRRNLDVLFSEYSWTGGFLWVGREGARAVPYLEEFDAKPEAIAMGVSGHRGEKTLVVDQPDAIEPGSWIDVMWYSMDSDSGIIQSIYGDTDLKIGSHHWSFDKRPLVRHRTRVLRVDGRTVHLASPLPHPVSDAVPAEVADWEPLERVGIEGVRLTFPQAAVFGHHVEKGYNGIYFTGAADGWVRDVTIENADAGILTDDAAHLSLLNIRIEGDRKGHYGIHMGAVQGVLAEGVHIMTPVIHSLTFNTKSTRSVYKDAVVWAEPVIDQHAGSNHQNLFDNVTLYLTAEGGEDGASYKVFDGSGAGYWQPGHGRYNTVWNLRLNVEGGMPAGETLGVLGLAEGPDARIVGLHGNRPLKLDYRPEPVVVSLGERVDAIPSLYAYQKGRRLAEGPED